MNDSPATRASLLVRLRDPRDAEAWNEFVDVYALIYRFAVKQHLQDADAADLTQETLRAVAGAIGRLDYDPGQGSFRGWLFTIVRNRLRDFWDRQKRQARGTGDTDMLELLERQPAPGDDLAQLWQREYEQQLFQTAARQVRGQFEDSTWQAFWRTAIDGCPGQQVAGELRISVAAVYLAKSRVMARLKEAVRRLQDQWEANP